MRRGKQRFGVGQRHGVGKQLATGVGIAHHICSGNPDGDRDYQRLRYPLPFAKPDAERVSQPERIGQPERFDFALIVP